MTTQRAPLCGRLLPLPSLGTASVLGWVWDVTGTSQTLTPQGRPWQVIGRKEEKTDFLTASCPWWHGPSGSSQLGSSCQLHGPQPCHTVPAAASAPRSSSSRPRLEPAAYLPTCYLGI